MGAVAEIRVVKINLSPFFIDGSVRVQSPSTKLAPRPANSDEIP